MAYELLIASRDAPTIFYGYIRYLFDFFDENRVIMIIALDELTDKFEAWAIAPGSDGYIGTYDNRKVAEEHAILKSFQILENQLQEQQ